MRFHAQLTKRKCQHSMSQSISSRPDVVLLAAMKKSRNRSITSSSKVSEQRLSAFYGACLRTWCTFAVSPR